MRLHLVDGNGMGRTILPCRLPALFMNVSAAIAESEVRTQCGILSSRHDHAKGARPRKRGGDAPGRSWPGVQAGGLAAQSVNILLGTGALLSGACPRSEDNGRQRDRHRRRRWSQSPRLRAPVSLGDCAISRRTVINNAGQGGTVGQAPPQTSEPVPPGLPFLTQNSERLSPRLPTQNSELNTQNY